ncbi:hypothetical protein HK405_010197, partial [Cladochytrium tenue]
SVAAAANAADGALAIDPPSSPTPQLVPMRVSEAVRAWRWSSVGQQYDWTRKEYHADRQAPVPPDLAAMVLAVVRAAEPVSGFPAAGYHPEAGIINFYQLGDSLTAHQDRSEEDDVAPLVSFSFGHACVFLMGKATREEAAPTPIILRSGDVMVMSGPCRRHFHGVPRILANTLPQYLRPEASTDDTDAPAGDGQDFGWELFGEFLSSARINVNVRQCRRYDDGDNGGGLGDSACGAGKPSLPPPPMSSATKPTSPAALAKQYATLPVLLISSGVWLVSYSLVRRLAPLLLANSAPLAAFASDLRSPFNGLGTYWAADVVPSAFAQGFFGHIAILLATILQIIASGSFWLSCAVVTFWGGELLARQLLAGPGGLGAGAVEELGVRAALVPAAAGLARVAETLTLAGALSTGGASSPLAALAAVLAVVRAAAATAGLLATLAAAALAGKDWAANIGRDGRQTVDVAFREGVKKKLS